MASIIPLPPINVADSGSHNSLLPLFLCLNSKITFEHKGQYHTGFLRKRDGIYHFNDKSHVNKCQEDWSVPLQNLPTKRVDLFVKSALLPGHVAHLFIRSPVSPHPSMFDPVASFVSALNLHCIASVLLHCSKLWPIHILIVRSGCKATRKKKEVSSPSTHAIKSLWGNIMPFAKQAFHKRSLICAS
jgi:hypothetical protein